MEQEDAALAEDQQGEVSRPRTSARRPEELGRSLERWLGGRLPEGAAPRVERVEVPEATGMSSETVLFDASWTEAGARRHERLVARVAPEPSAVPVFPVYDLGRQFRVMRLVGEKASVPVPRVYWFEPDASAIGSPFFVMGRVDGEVPPDIMPYTLGSWLLDASEGERRRLQSRTVEVIARIHAIPDPEETFSFLRPDSSEPTALRRHVADQRSYYEWVASDGLRSPLIEAGFSWLEEHWPEEEGKAVLSWGDSRVGNIIYREFEPVAVLDWEMASLAPREVDLGWLCFLHRFFEDIASAAGAPGMPDFLRPGDVARQYESATGYAPRDLDFYMTYAAIRHGIVMSRVQRRAIHFGEAVMPADVDDLILHRATLESMLDGTYWGRLRP
jgi:aminoglycoside phosphotransferase (APT) family kinase protein